MKPILLFDFDGVICDALPNALKLIQELMMPDFTQEEFYQTFITNFWENPKTKVITPEIKEHFSATKRIRVQENPDNWGPLFPGMKEVVEQLSQYYTLYVVSSNQQRVIEMILEHHNMSDLFEAVQGRNIPGNKQDKILKLLNDFPHEMKGAYLVTDSVGDVREAHEAGIAAIGVTWGIHDAPLFKRFNTEHVCETPEELLKILA